MLALFRSSPLQDEEGLHSIIEKKTKKQTNEKKKNLEALASGLGG